MLRKFGSMVAMLMLCSLMSGAMAQEKATKDVTKVVFNNGVTYDGKVPVKLEPVTKAIKDHYPSATFKVDGEKLLVGLDLKDAAKGEVLQVTWQSDCPVNSQYQYSQPKVIITKVLRPTLVAWTQVRHDHLGLGKAGVQSYTEGDGRAEVTLARN